ncbi:MAG: VaFE repeat-containing surface-anchored protein [Ruminococcus sp.]|nr:VaFE repeat-containing surface-anchored protein [Ruminococcus sp.]
MKKYVWDVRRMFWTAFVFLSLLGVMTAACVLSVQAEVQEEKEGEDAGSGLNPEKTPVLTENVLSMEQILELENQIMEQESGEGVRIGRRSAQQATVAQVLGMDGAVYIDWLQSHEEDSYYLGTPYKPFDWRSPNGDPVFNGGEAGMNCTGFVWHALTLPTMQSGGNTTLIPGLSGWVTFYKTYNIQRQYFQTKEEMLASGYLEKGDIIWMFDGSEATVSDFHHIAIYWGDGRSDLVWHSIDGASDGNGLAYDGNILSQIVGKRKNPIYVVLKVGGIERPKTGNLQLKKVAQNPGITEGNASYSLGGAEYTVYADPTCLVPVGSFTTDEEGNSGSLELTAGEYWIQETKAPEGFWLNQTAQEPEKVTVTAGETTVYQSADLPQYAEVSLVLSKTDAETGKSGNFLKDAEFSVEFYGGFYDSAEETNGVVPLKSWICKTNGKGELLLDTSARVSGDSFYTVRGETEEEEIPVLPLGTVVIRETRAPIGYLKNTDVFVVKITGCGSEDPGPVYTPPVIPEIPQKGVLQIQKLDAETKTEKPQGGATLAGAVYEVRDVGGNLVEKLVTDDQGKAQSRELQFGVYTVKEQLPSAGYLLNEETIQVELKPQNTEERVFYTSVESMEQIIRGDLELTKIGGGDTQHKRLAGVPFRITSRTTGESHVIVTDRNGYASTESAWNPHGQYVNRGKTEKDGVWFGAEPVVEKQGALPYDTYEIREIECEGNQGYRLIEPFDMVIERNKKTVDLDTLTDVPDVPVRIGTTALDADSRTQTLSAGEDVTIVDTVMFEHLEVGKEYTIRGVLMDKETGKPLLVEKRDKEEETEETVEGTENPGTEGTENLKPGETTEPGDDEDHPGREMVTVEKRFYAPVSTGIVEMPFTFSSAGLDGKTVVVFETVFADGRKIASDEDLEEQNQTVRFIKEPEEPETPENPETPEKPQEPQTPVTPETLQKPQKTIQTGDAFSPVFVIAAVGSALVMLAAAGRHGQRGGKRKGR